MTCSKSDSDSISIAAETLRKGGVAILPTDTVYGFSGIVDCPGKKAFCTETKPFIQLISSPDEISRFSDETMPEELLRLWPGPLTVILRLTTGGSAAFRCPGDKWLRRVIESCGSPIYSTSVNRSGKPVLRSIQDIRREFEGEVDLIVDDGDTGESLPSTIVKIEDGRILTVRQGALKIEATV